MYPMLFFFILFLLASLPLPIYLLGIGIFLLIWKFLSYESIKG